MKLRERSATIRWEFGLTLGGDETLRQVAKAAQQYWAWGKIEGLTEGGSIDADTPINDGEWGIISRLAQLYVELENARALETSRAIGVEVWGRSTSEITADIAALERDELPMIAFSEEVITV